MCILCYHHDDLFLSAVLFSLFICIFKVLDFLPLNVYFVGLQGQSN